MGSGLITFFCFSILSLVVGCVDASLPSLAGWQTTILLGVAIAFSRLKGKRAFSILAVVFSIQLLFQARLPDDKTLPVLIGTGNLLLFLLLAQIPDFAGQRKIFQTLTILFWAIGLCGYLYLPPGGADSVRARMILVAFMWIFATFFLIPTRFGEMEHLPSSVILALLVLWYTKEPLLSIGLLIGTVARQYISPKWAWLSLLFVPLLNLNRFFAIPLGCFIMLVGNGSMPDQFALCLFPLFFNSLWALFPLLAVGVFFGIARTMPYRRRNSGTPRNRGSVDAYTRHGTSAQTNKRNTSGDEPMNDR